MRRLPWSELNDSLAFPKPSRAGRERRRLEHTRPLPRRNEAREAAQRELTRGPQWEACHELPCCARYRDHRPLTPETIERRS